MLIKIIIMDDDINSRHDSDEETEIDLSTPAPATPRLEVLEKSGSYVWNYFTKDSDFKSNKKATCNQCKATYICSGGSTSNLKHLKRHSIQKEQKADESVVDLLNASKVSIIYNLFIYFYRFFIIIY